MSATTPTYPPSSTIIERIRAHNGPVLTRDGMYTTEYTTTKAPMRASEMMMRFIFLLSEYPVDCEE